MTTLDRGDIDAVRQFLIDGYKESDSYFRVSISDLVKEFEFDEDYIESILNYINGYAELWEGNFMSGRNLIVSSPVYDRLTSKGW
ncbi:MAG: hypothetical protein KKE73_08260 [Proteobacteria bacterium]|nr:hypothetical protein [Pseudomonadota bacterium]